MKFRDSQIQSPTLLFELEDELALRMGHSQSVMEAIAQLQVWTDTDAYLVNLLSQQLIECLPLVVSGGEKQLIDDLVQRKIVDDWRHNTASAHLRGIEATLLGYPQLDSLMILYLKVLQRGETEVEGGAEQAVLIDSGLVVQDGDLLRVANAVYAAVFDLDWIEQQVPGLTKPVSIVRSGVLPIEGSRRLEPVSDKPSENARSRATSLSQPTPETKLYSKAMVLACCMAVAIAVVVTYARGSRQPSLAAGDPAQSAGSIEAGAVSSSAASSNAELSTREGSVTVSSSESLSDKQLFDSGSEHATNGRWLMMMREFCQISESSAYFEPAKRNMNKWMALYKADIAAAKAAFDKEDAQACAVMSQTKTNESEPDE